MELTNFADAGDVSVLDARRVLVSRDGLDGRTEISSSVATFADTDPRAATGNAGLVTVEADEVTLRDSGTIFSVSRGAGDGGTVAVTADRIELTGGGQIASGTLDLSTGRGGNVAVTSREELTISGQSRQINPRTGRPEPSGIFVSSESVAEAADRAGRATVSAPVITITNRGEISSESVSNQSSGRLTLSAEQLVIDGGEITTQAEGAGGGGRIEVRAGVIELRNGGLISAQSTGSDGTVATSEPAVDLKSALVVLAAPLLDADSLLREPCAARQDVGTSSFIGVGRGGLPAAPDRPLGSAYRSAEAQAAGATSIRPAALRLPCSSTH